VWPESSESSYLSLYLPLLRGAPQPLIQKVDAVDVNRNLVLVSKKSEQNRGSAVGFPLLNFWNPLRRAKHPLLSVIRMISTMCVVLVIITRLFWIVGISRIMHRRPNLVVGSLARSAFVRMIFFLLCTVLSTYRYGTRVHKFSKWIHSKMFLYTYR
jgi:hypothetical protein